MLFKQCNETGVFPSENKTKRRKQTLKTSAQFPFWLFLVSFFVDFFIENELISSNQSGFKPGDSCFN